jgi:hypothetical protein
VRVREVQLIAPDKKRALVMPAVPVWKCRAVNLKSKVLIDLVDDVSAEVSQASSHNGLALIGRSAGSVTRRKIWEATGNEYYRISPVRIEHQQAFCIWAISVELSTVYLGYDRNERPGTHQLLWIVASGSSQWF